jgi:hypothetical protein
MGWQSIGGWDDRLTTDTVTDLSGLLKGDGGTLEVAVAGVDYTVPPVSAIAVGDYYFNSTGINPGMYLGYGTWTQIAQGLFLVGAP